MEGPDKNGLRKHGAQSLCGAKDMSEQDRIKMDFLELTKYGAVKYLEKISKVVRKNCCKQIELKKVEKYTFKIGSFKDTSYRDEPDLLEEWEQLYLPDHVKMEVIGFLEEFPCNADSAELVLMVCEDRKVFAYEDERLHLVASDLKELFECGVQFPGSQYYYRGQRFKRMTDKDWTEVKKSKQFIENSKEHQKNLENMKNSFLENLDIIRQRKQELVKTT